MKKLSFWQELSDDHYKTFPEQWTNEPLYLYGENAVLLFQVSDPFEITRNRYEGEIFNEKGIWRAGRLIWEIGRVYGVLKKESNIDSPEGWTKLIRIRTDKTEFILKFKKVERK